MGVNNHKKKIKKAKNPSTIDKLTKEQNKNKLATLPQ